MPCVSEFLGISIYFYYNDHPPPHFHAIYGEHEAWIGIEGFEVLRGSLPNRAKSLVLEWAALHTSELVRELAREGKELIMIEPLE